MTYTMTPTEREYFTNLLVARDIKWIREGYDAGDQYLHAILTGEGWVQYKNLSDRSLLELAYEVEGVGKTNVYFAEKKRVLEKQGFERLNDVVTAEVQSLMERRDHLAYELGPQNRDTLFMDDLIQAKNEELIEVRRKLQAVTLGNIVFAPINIAS